MRSNARVDRTIPCVELPPADTTRWVASRKADVVHAIRSGIVTRDEARRRYSLSDEELRIWERALDAAGVPGLRVTRVQIYRDTFASYH